ncbi:putative disulfide-isomerase [Enhygromyxa salina]|uniref:Putative disulfide-isomerase n=1 Tax=Enhygromyxa salina TaxID=215803 RepID=A0A0C2CK17_9BACT|nr:thioredoxin family protein [Enhygromyxa salina]KIG11576.1 putative disulfide-isomerase [Enhygromyxa salina]
MARALLTGLALIVSLPSCGGEEHEPPRGPEFEFGPAPARPDAPTEHVLANTIDGAAVPGLRDDGSIVFAVQWFDGGLEAALNVAKDQAKLVFVDVGAYWCPPCHELDEKTFTDPRVGEWMAKHAVAVHVDAEKGDGPDIVERYHVQAYPTLLVLEASGIEKGRLVDFIEPDALLTKLDELKSGGNVLAELEAAVEAAPDDTEARYQLGHAYVLAARQQDAERVYASVIADDIDNAKGLTSKVIYDLAMFFTMKLENDPETAILQLQALQSKFPDSAEATKAYRMIGRALCQLGKPDEAAASLEAMVATDPDNVELKSSFGWFAFREKCRPDAGLKAVLAGIEQDPASADLRYLEAELREQLGEHALALAAIRKASELEPESAYYKRQVRRFEALTGE